MHEHRIYVQVHHWREYYVRIVLPVRTSRGQNQRNFSEETTSLLIAQQSTNLSLLSAGPTAESGCGSGS